MDPRILNEAAVDALARRLGELAQLDQLAVDGMHALRRLLQEVCDKLNGSGRFASAQGQGLALTELEHPSDYAPPDAPVRWSLLFRGADALRFEFRAGYVSDAVPGIARCDVKSAAGDSHGYLSLASDGGSAEWRGHPGGNGHSGKVDGDLVVWLLNEFVAKRLAKYRRPTS